MELFKILGSIAIDNTKANKALQETATRAGTTTTEIEAAVNKIGSFAVGIAKGIGTIAGIMGTAWIAAIESTREYRTQMGQLDTAFQAAGHSSEAAKNTYTELNAVLGDSGQAVEASQHLAKLTDNEKDLKTWTDICTGVYATFGESLPIESLTEAANETAKTGILTGGLTDALNWAGISEEQFQEKLDKCTNEQERQKLIMDTLNGTYAKASEQYKETNKDILAANRANERLTAAFAELGRVGEPILTAVKNAVAGMVEAAVPHLENFVNKVKDGIKWIKKNEETVDAWIAVIIGASTAIGAFLLILNWGKIMTAAANAIKTVRLAMLALNAAMRANPIGLVVSLIAGLVAAFIYLWNTNDDFRAFWIKTWNKIKSAGASAISYIKGKFNDFKGALKTVKNTFSDIKDTITDKLDSARAKVKSVIDKIKGYFATTLKFKGLKMPSIKLTMQKGSGLMAKAAELLGLSGVPKFSVKWNAEGGILTKPTIFAMRGNTFLGGGEAGAEAIAPIDTLQKYIREAVAPTQSGENTTEIIDLLRRIVFLFEKNSGAKITLDTGALVGALTPEIDTKLNTRYAHMRRGNTI